MVSPPRCRMQACYLHLHRQEPPLHLQQLYNLSIRLLRLPFLDCRCHHLRLLHRPSRLLPDQGPLLRPENGTLLLHFWLPLARIHGLYLRYPHQHCRICWRHWEAGASGCPIHLQYQLLCRVHCCGPDILDLVQDQSDPGLQ